MSEEPTLNVEDALTSRDLPLTAEVHAEQILYRLELAQAIRKYHHDALWEAEKHYSWLVSFILSATFLVLGSGKAAGVRFTAGVMLSGVGAVIFYIAAKVVRRERGPFD